MAKGSRAGRTQMFAVPCHPITKLIYSNRTANYFKAVANLQVLVFMKMSLKLVALELSKMTHKISKPGFEPWFGYVPKAASVPAAQTGAPSNGVVINDI